MASEERMRALALLSEPSPTLQIEADQANEAALSQSVIGSRWNNRFLWVALGFAALLSVVAWVVLPDAQPGHPQSVPVIAFNPVLPILPVLSAGPLRGRRPRTVSISPLSKLVLPPVYYAVDRLSKRVPLRTAARLGGSVDGSSTELENGITITQGEIAKGQMADIQNTAELLSYNFFDYGVGLNSLLGKLQRCTMGGMFTVELQSTVQSQAEKPKPQCILLLAKQREELVGASLVHTQMFNEGTQEFRPQGAPPWDIDKFITVAVLSNVVVRKDKRGLGLGADLLAAAEKEARAWKYPKLFVLVEADNPRSRNLYESRGFTKLREKNDLNFLVPGRRFVQLKKVKLWIMSKTLSDEPGSTSSGQHNALANLEVDEELAIREAKVDEMNMGKQIMEQMILERKAKVAELDAQIARKQSGAAAELK